MLRFRSLPLRRDIGAPPLWRDADLIVVLVTVLIVAMDDICTSVTLPAHRAGGIFVSVTLLIVAANGILASVTVLDLAAVEIIVSVTLCIPGAAGSPFR